MWRFQGGNCYSTTGVQGKAVLDQLPKSLVMQTVRPTPFALMAMATSALCLDHLPAHSALVEF
jgi:hypothetical protein